MKPDKKRYGISTKISVAMVKFVTLYIITPYIFSLV